MLIWAIMRLVVHTGLLDKSHHVYMDNYYSCLELYEELHSRNTFACGTVNLHHKNL